MPEVETKAGGAAVPGLKGVRWVVAVGSGKGGVGKSTVTVNLAVAAAALGLRVGMADVDVYGPSLPMMMGVSGAPVPADNELIAPLEVHGVKLMSMGLFIDDSSPVVWRGPMAMSATRQFLRGVDWGELDLLLVDLPPGTGDVVLTLAQEIPLDGALVVSTPQELALEDVDRAVAMLAKVGAPVLGLVRNMVGYRCPECGTFDPIFGDGDPGLAAERLGCEVLAELPIVEPLRSCGDAGTPIVKSAPDHEVSRSFMELAAHLRVRLEGGVADGCEPASVERDDALLRIRWPGGTVDEYALSGLRGWCPCAACQGHGGERGFVEVDAVELESFERVGRYALKLNWKDGHDSGIYTFDYLRELASSPECRVGG